MFTEEELKALPVPLTDMFQRLETEVEEKICERVQKIGEASISDANRLRELSHIGRDLNEIEKRIAETVDKSKQMIRDLLNAAAETEYDDTFEGLRQTWVPFFENPAASNLVSSIAEAVHQNIEDAAGLSGSASGTTGFLNAAGNWEPLARHYQRTVDYALLQVRSGQRDFHSAMRGAVKAMADNGLTHVTYNNEGKKPYVRRLDSSVRNAFMGGQQRLSRQLAQIQGKAFGATGYEVSWHSGARPTHVPMGGQQYDIEAFHREAEPLLNEYNCYHRAWPIVLGVSQPVYTQEELDELNAKDAELHTFEGKEYNAYTASQMQRRFETAIRREKDRAVLFKASGDKQGEISAKAKVTALKIKYGQFSDAVKLSVKQNRLPVPGYTRGAAVKNVAKELTKPGRRSRITYGTSQEEIDRLIENKLSGICFTMHPVYNARALNGFTKVEVSPFGERLIVSVVIGKQERPGEKFLLDSIVHEELEARIYKATTEKAEKLVKGTEKERHKHIQKIIDRYFRMKGW
jgi:hypothetical protein